VAAERYPTHAGASGRTPATLRTSADAADAIGATRAALQRVVLRALAELGEATVLEAVARTGRSRESTQPRFSELIEDGLVEPTGQRRRNPSGRTAAVLRLTVAGQRALTAG